MLVPPPPPSWSLAPGAEELSDEVLAMLDRCLGSLTGHIESALVIRVETRRDHHVVELATGLGPLLVIERRAAPGRRAA